MAAQKKPVIDEVLLAARAEILNYYSPPHLQRVPPEQILEKHAGMGRARRFGSAVGEEILPMSPAAGQWLLQHLPWDTEFFGTATYRLFTGLFGAATVPEMLVQAAVELQGALNQRGPHYTFAVVPTEDVALLQALSGSGWRLIETRLTYYRSTIEPLPEPPAAMRLAQADEAAYIGRISAAARNPFDRFHADPWFGPVRADAMLARYAEAAVLGTYADAVLVPDESGQPVDSFLAVGDTPADPARPGSGWSRVLLTAVGPRNRGWHLPLVAAAVRRATARQLPYLLMTTQATNRPVIRTCEKLGFRLGGTAHVLACFSA